MSDNDGYRGTQQPNSGTDEFNALSFIFRQLLNGRNFVALVKVVSVTAPGGLALAGTVDVQPLVNQLDGDGKAVPHGIVNDLPYTRAQGGLNAVIMDPQVGDIGLCVFCDRDSSAAQATRGVANPGSLRRSDMADGVYIGGVLNAIPNQYVMFTEDGIKMVSPTLIRMEAPEINLVAPIVTIDASESTTITTPIFTVNGESHFNGNTTTDGDTQLNGSATATGTVTAPTINGTTNVLFGGISGTGHKHGGVDTGPDQTGTPV